MTAPAPEGDAPQRRAAPALTGGAAGWTEQPGARNEQQAAREVGGSQRPGDAKLVELQLGRPPRALRRVAHRCPCGLPDVVETAPRLANGAPFPTLFYLTCPRAAAALSRLESAGMMRDMEQRLATEPGLRAAQQAAHQDYLARRDAAAVAGGLEPLPAGTQSAGGMPGRVKCLHALAAHELAVPGANPLGRAALDAAGEWWSRGRCVP